jgi:cell division protein FtsB
MKRITFISLFVFTHISFVFLQIHKHALFIKQSYSKQKNEKLCQNLRKKKQDIAHQLHTFKNNQDIKEFAQKELQMVQLRVNQIKKLNPDD